MGQDEEAPGTDAIKFPRGLTYFSLLGHSDLNDIQWKITGNLGGEQYLDLVRGPRNEGAIYAERMGWHLSSPPSQDWEGKSPIADGLEKAGVGFFTTTFELDMPSGWDIPLSFVFNGTKDEGHGTGGNYRLQLFVNGWQFGKYGELLRGLDIETEVYFLLIWGNSQQPRATNNVPSPRRNSQLQWEERCFAYSMES